MLMVWCRRAVQLILSIITLMLEDQRRDFGTEGGE